MKNNKRSFIITLSILLVVLLAGCGNAASGVNQQEQNQQNQDVHSGDTGTTEQPALENEETEESASPNLEVTDQKAEYLKKLNEMEELDKNAEAGTTMVEMNEQEAKRYEKWDAELNAIYGILKEQLGTEEMEELRAEQRDWVTYRDQTAEEAAQKYEGGSMETLEYAATQAQVTKERCYELVAKYME